MVYCELFELVRNLSNFSLETEVILSFVLVAFIYLIVYGLFYLCNSNLVVLSLKSKRP